MINLCIGVSVKKRKTTRGREVGREQERVRGGTSVICFLLTKHFKTFLFMLVLFLPYIINLLCLRAKTLRLREWHLLLGEIAFTMVLLRCFCSCRQKKTSQKGKDSRNESCRTKTFKIKRKMRYILIGASYKQKICA